MIERWHRTLKTALKAPGKRDWVQALPSVLLGLRAVLKEDIGLSVSELVYGMTIRVPGDFFRESTVKTPEHEFVQSLRNNFNNIRPVPASDHSSRRPFVFKDLADCEKVFVHVDSHLRPLQKPYRGPYTVVRRLRKSFVLDIDGKVKTISIDRLIPAYLESSQLDLSLVDHDCNVPQVALTTKDGLMSNDNKFKKYVSFVI